MSKSEKISKLANLVKESVTTIDLIPTVSGGENYYVYNEDLFGGMPKSSITKIVAASDTPNATSRSDYECDGTADDIQIQAAIDALPAGGGTVLLLEGTFNLVTTITMANSNRLIGSGWNTIVDVSGWTAAVSSVVMGDRCVLADLKISGSIAPLHDYFEGVFANDNCLIQNVWMSNLGKGITVSDKDNVHINDCKFDTLKSTSGWSTCVNVTGSSCTNTFINNIYADDCDRGIEIEDGASNVFCRGGYLKDIVDMTLNVHTHIGEGGCENVLFDGFYLENTSSIDLGGLVGDRAANLTAKNITIVTPINLGGAVGVVAAVYVDHLVIENIVMSFTGHGRALYARYSDQVIIKDCKITNDTSIQSILLDGSSNISIRDSRFSPVGVRLQAGAAGDIVEQVVFDGNYVESSLSPVLRIEPYMTKCRVLNNHIVGVGAPALGIEIQALSEDIDVVSNHVEGAGTYSIRCYQTRGKVFHNTVDRRMQVEAAATSVWIHHNYIDELGIGDAGSTSPRFFMNHVTTDNAGFASAMGQIYSYSIANVTNPPTDGEIDGAFGTPRDVGSGFIGIINDNAASLLFWQCISDGTNWWYQGMTKAT